MKKKTIRIVGIVAVVVCIAVSALAVLRVRYISIGNSGRIFLYTPLGKNSIGGSAQSDLTDQLRGKYGEDTVTSVLAKDGLTVNRTVWYEFEYIGRDLKGGNYVRCLAVTVYTEARDGGEPVEIARRDCEYIGYDDGDLNSTARARILWDTLTVRCLESEGDFSAVENDYGVAAGL